MLSSGWPKMIPVNTTLLSSVDVATIGPSLDIRVSCEFGQTSEEVRLGEPGCTPLENQSWMLCRLSANPSVLDRIKSEPGIYVTGKCCGGRSYEVAVCKSAIPLLRILDCGLDLKYDPTKPVDEVCVHSVRGATTRAEARFLENALKVICSECPRGVKSCYRTLALSRHLEIRLDLAILNHDFQQSNPQVLRKLAQHFVFLGLNLLESYDTPAAIELLGKSQDELLFEAFRRYNKSILSSGITNGEKRQTISLVRSLVEAVGGRKYFRQHRVSEFKACANAKIYGSFVGITGSNPFGKFDPEKMLSALARCEFFNNEDIRMLDVIGWSRRMMTFLPIGKPDGDVDLPAYVLNELGAGQVDILRVSVAQFYRQHPSLQTPDNNILVLLVCCATINGEIARVLSDWTASSDGSSFYKVLVEKHQEPQTVQQLALSLATLLSYKQLLPHTSKGPTPLIGRSSFADFVALINGSTLTNEREVFECMMFSFLRVLGTFRDEHQEVIQLLVTVLDTDPPSLNPLDGFLDQFWAQRMHGLSHKDAFDMVELNQSLTTTCLGSKVEEDWVMDGYECSRRRVIQL